jgi:myosin heavy subunit
MTGADTPSADELPTPRLKREMTEKQKAVLAASRIKAIEVRRENAELRAKEKEVERREKAATLEARKKRVADALGGSAPSTSPDVPTLQQEDTVEQPEPTPEQDVASEPEEQEQEARPAKAKKSKKKKKVVYVTDSSESETASDSEEIQYVRRKKSSSSRRGRSPTRRNDIPAAPQQPMYSADYLRVFGSPY